ncbi:hypothetical protein [Rheinheimera pleomorphica]|uniref:hypothetical protein n=1 Tax=Rheinheimera pleomorphica TaxID=2703963 RepID=UPI00141F5527|nr:hypothetical protein [Rheinheimera pleomorphica]
MFLAFAYSGALYLLKEALIDSSAFVTLIIAGTCVSLIFIFAPLVSEITIAGNVIKLREVKSQAEKSIAEFDSARISLLVAVISTLKTSLPELSHALAKTDNRAGQFLDLYNSNKDLVNNEQFRREVLSAAKVFKYEVFNQIQMECFFSGEDMSKAVMPDAMDRLFIEKYGASKPLTPVFKQYRELYTLVELLS